MGKRVLPDHTDKEKPKHETTRKVEKVMNKLNEQKQVFIALCKAYIKREGIEELLDWLETTDFYTAPASTKYHGAYPGGLVEHSLNVYRRLTAKQSDMPAGTKNETIALTALLHDICKVNTYEQTGTIYTDFEQNAYTYAYKNEFPIGHGEKSVILIQRHMRLTEEEITAISWHMGGFDERKKELSEAWKKYPLAVLLHLADMEATWLDERWEEQ